MEPLIDTMLTIGNSTEGISSQNFMKYVIQVLKCDLSEQDVELFLKSDPGLRDEMGYISKYDLVRIFDEPYRISRLRQQESNQYQRQKLTEAQTMAGIDSDSRNLIQMQPVRQSVGFVQKQSMGNKYNK